MSIALSVIPSVLKSDCLLTRPAFGKTPRNGRNIFISSLAFGASKRLKLHLKNWDGLESQKYLN